MDIEKELQIEDILKSLREQIGEQAQTIAILKPDHNLGSRRHAQRGVVADPKRHQRLLFTEQQCGVEKDLLLACVDGCEFMQVALQFHQRACIVDVDLVVVRSVRQVGNLDLQVHAGADEIVLGMCMVGKPVTAMAEQQ